MLLHWNISKLVILKKNKIKSKIAVCYFMYSPGMSLVCVMKC
jgi:hypothetical protein